MLSADLNQVFDTIGSKHVSILISIGILICNAVTDPVEQLLINAFLNLWSLLLAVLGGLYCDRIGRRPLFLLSTVGMIVFFTLQTICSSQYALHGNKAAGNAVVAFICG